MLKRAQLPKRKSRGPDKKKRKQRSDTKPKTWHQYNNHKGNAEKGGVPFLLSYEEWLAIWEESGHLEERGCRSGQYVMARYGDQGAYEVGNVRICTTIENHKEQWDNSRYIMINKMIAAHTGMKDPPQTRANKSRAAHSAWQKRLPPLTEEQVQQILDMSTTNSIPTIAQHFGIGKKRVYNIIQRGYA